MANANVETTVSVEATLHRELRKLMQEIWDRHRIRVTDINVYWTVQQSASGQDLAQAQSIQLRSES